MSCENTKPLNINYELLPQNIFSNTKNAESLDCVDVGGREPISLVSQ